MSTIQVNSVWPMINKLHVMATVHPEIQPGQDVDASVPLLELMMPSIEVNVKYNQRSSGKSSQ